MLQLCHNVIEDRCEIDFCIDVLPDNQRNVRLQFDEYFLQRAADQFLIENVDDFFYLSG